MIKAKKKSYKYILVVWTWKKCYPHPTVRVLSVSQQIKDDDASDEVTLTKTTKPNSKVSLCLCSLKLSACHFLLFQSSEFMRILFCLILKNVFRIAQKRFIMTFSDIKLKVKSGTEEGNQRQYQSSVSKSSHGKNKSSPLSRRQTDI